MEHAQCHVHIHPVVYPGGDMRLLGRGGKMNVCGSGFSIQAISVCTGTDLYDKVYQFVFVHLLCMEVGDQETDVVTLET